MRVVILPQLTYIHMTYTSCELEMFWSRRTLYFDQGYQLSLEQYKLLHHLE